MQFEVIILFFTTIIGAFFSYFLLRSERHRINILFSIFSLAVALWSVNLAFFILTNDLSKALLHANAYYVAGAAIPLILLFFSQYFKRPKETFGFLEFLFLLPFFLLVSLVIIDPNFIIENIRLVSWGKDVELNLYNYIAYSTYFVGYVSITYANFWHTYKWHTSARADRKQLQFVLSGLLLGYILGMTFNLLLPAIGIYQYIWAGPLGVIIVVAFVGYAIIRYKLFDLKVIVTEILIAIMWIFLLIRTIIAQSLTDQIANGALLLVTVIVGILLIRSVLKEVKSRERIEKLAQRLQSANDRLKELDRMKTEFLSIASHQFRSPLTAIKGYTSNMLDGTYGEIPEKLQTPIDRVFTSADHLALIVDDFLNLSRIEQGRMDYEMEKVDLKKFVESAVDEQRAVAEKKGLDLSFKTEGEDFTAKIDRGKFKQVVTNFIDNALKYTPKGSIKVSLERIEGRIRISVADTGVGVPKDEVDTLFGQFKRATNANNANVMGTGLGLYIAKEIVKAHKGDIWVESEGEGKGSTFIVEVPHVG